MSKSINIPKDWELSTVGKLLKISTGDKDTQDKIEDGKYPFFVRSNVIERLDSYSFDGEAVLTAGDGVGVGKVYHYYKGKFAFHQRVYAIYGFDKKINAQYFYRYFSENFLSEVERYSAKNSVDSVRLNMISDMEIFLPPIKEQEKIAEILSEVDSAIDKAEAYYEKNQKIKTALMQDLLTHGIDEKGKIRNPKTHQYKPSPLGDIPMEWEEDYLRDITILIKDGTHGTHKDVNDGVPLLSAKDIGEGKINLNNNPRLISENDYKQIHKNYTILENDILLTIVGTIGGIAQVKTKQKFTLQRSVAIVRFKDLDSDFAYYSALDNDFYRQLIDKVNASAQGGIYLGSLSQCKIKYPKSKTEQQKIAKILSSQDEKIEKAKSKLKKLKSLKTALMQDLLSGTKRVNHLLGEEI
ncbi:restriction endonuclease subunit S [Arcobacter sp. KX21116]|uniref:restriction endonuclease subunit S n=1 Tax=Arcobacter iocasae TaxID=2906515 RepID=UPI0035D3E88F